MSRFHYGLTVLLLLIPAACVAFPDIAYLPKTLDESFDLSWQFRVSGALTVPFILDIERTSQSGHRLALSDTLVRWEHIDGRGDSPPIQASLRLQPNHPYTFTLKRRQGTMAFLCNHRLVFSAPFPSRSPAKGTITFHTLPPNLNIKDIRYQRVEPCVFGDDFMRQDTLPKLLARYRGEWVDDDNWRVDFYRKVDPGSNPHDSRTGASLQNPWQLNYYPDTQKTANGFWFLYTGDSPSWVVPHEIIVPSWWDSYYVQAAVRPDYESAVGLLAAYQDPQNYLLFRWKSREHTEAVRAELVAMIDGTSHTLATSTQGFTPMQWYTVRLNLSWQKVQACIDDQVLFDVPNPGPIEGRFGLYADGTPHPQRPMLDAGTSSMFVVKDAQGREVNEAADAMRPTCYILYDDVQVKPWRYMDMIASPYQIEQSGQWTQTKTNQLIAGKAGRWLPNRTVGDERTACSVQVQIPVSGSAGLFIRLDDTQTGWLWTFTTREHCLRQVTAGQWGAITDRFAGGIASGTWVTLRVEVDGPYIACFCDGQRVLETYDPSRVLGRYGMVALAQGAQFQNCMLQSLPPYWKTAKFHGGFLGDKWLITWSSPEADWVPAVIHPAAVTALGDARSTIGAAAPYPTNSRGLYWNKGSYYHDARVFLPLTVDSLADQKLYFSDEENIGSGYRCQFARQADGGMVRFWRQDQLVGEYRFPMTSHSQAIFERRGSFLALRIQALDPDVVMGEPEVEQETLVFIYRDPHPIHATRIGFQVTAPSLPAAAIRIESDRIQDTFETAPVGWMTQSGIWQVMARYSCRPEWNWFGGFGSGLPTVWHKMRLEGDQSVEVYLGVKMQYDDMREDEARRFRDLNVTICADGVHLNSGYTVIRAGHLEGQSTTMLLRQGVIVKTSTELAHLLPPGIEGHRQWFATRIEKHGNEIRVYLDNSLAFTYMDPDPLPGGYAAVWSRDNGIMIGRANLSAERMVLGLPATTPSALPEELSPLPTLPVTINGMPIALASFETGVDNWQERPGLTARLIRERVTHPISGSNTYATIVNAYPAGDGAVTLSRPINLSANPIFHAEYCFDLGALINLYVKYQGTWYEIVLSGRPARDVTCMRAGTIPVQADGQWHHLAVDVGRLLTQAITKATGQTPTNLLADEVIFADWSAPADLRAYGFGNMPGGTTASFDNAGFLPRLTGTATIAWAGIPDALYWKVSVDHNAFSVPTTASTDTRLTVPVGKDVAFVHLLGLRTDGQSAGCLHVPIVGDADMTPAQSNNPVQAEGGR